MAVTEQKIRREGLIGNHSATGKDNTTAIYRTEFDGPETNAVTVLALQRAYKASGYWPPEDGQIYAPGQAYLFARNFVTVPVDDNLMLWDTTVTWTVPDDGQDAEVMQPNPLFRPPVFNIEFIETEYPIELAENLDALPHGGGGGGDRAVNTIGDLVNAAGKRPDEPQVATERNAVLVIERNYANLDEIVAVNQQYKRSTNSDSFQGFDQETLVYMVTDSLGKRTEGNYTYFPGVTRIEQKKSSLRIVSNMGYAYWDATAEKITEDKDGFKDLHNLRMDGTKIPAGSSEQSWIRYRYLNMIDYAPLVA